LSGKKGKTNVLVFQNQDSISFSNSQALAVACVPSFKIGQKVGIGRLLAGLLLTQF
jgi:hypothetical protein